MDEAAAACADDLHSSMTTRGEGLRSPHDAAQEVALAETADGERGIRAEVQQMLQSYAAIREACQPTLQTRAALQTAPSHALFGTNLNLESLES